MNIYAIRAIYLFELGRSLRTLFQSLASPVISTSLYFVVFGSAIGSRMHAIDGVSYGAFIVPGLIMLAVLTESTANASFGIYMPRFTGTVYELLSAPVSAVEAVIGYVGAAATKSARAGAGHRADRAGCLCPIPLSTRSGRWPSCVMTSVSFSLFGFILGLWADGFEKLQIVPTMIITPLTFLGGTFYSITMLPKAWQTVSLFNPIVYLVNGFRWAFYGQADVSLGFSLGMIVGIHGGLRLGIITWIFKTGWRLRT